jgi:hypothetical protein
MSIAVAVQQAIVPKMCKFGAVLADLPDDDSAAIRNGFLAGLTPTEAARILRDNGHQVSNTAAKTHASKDCCCEDAR